MPVDNVREAPYLDASRHISGPFCATRLGFLRRRHRQPVNHQSPLHSDVPEVQEVVTILDAHVHAQPFRAVALHAALGQRKEQWRLRLLHLPEARVRLACGEHEAVDAELRVVNGIAKVPAVAHHLQCHLSLRATSSRTRCKSALASHAFVCRKQGAPALPGTRGIPP